LSYSIVFLEHAPQGEEVLQRCFGRETFNYHEAVNALIAQRAWWSDYYPAAFEPMDVRASVLYPNVRSLQLRWASMQKLPERTSPDAVLLAQLEQISPEVVFIHQDDLVLRPELHRRIRNRVRSVKLIFAYYGTFSWRLARRVNNLDLLFVPCQWMVDALSSVGIRAARLLHGFGRSVLQDLDVTRERDIPISMVGNLKFVGTYFDYRNTVVEAMIEHTPLQVWGSVGFGSALQKQKAATSWHANTILRKIGVSRGLRRKIPLVQWGCDWTQNPLDRAGWNYSDRIHPPAYGPENWDVLSRSRIALNVHADIAREESVNFRLFEATGAGACLLTNYTDDLGKLFRIDEEVVAYKSPSEAVEKARYLLENPDIAERIAQAGHKRTLSSHTYAQRAEWLNRTILRMLQ